MTKYCQYCKTESGEENEFCIECHQPFEDELDFEKPIRDINQLSAKILNKDIPCSPNQLKDLYSEIMDSVQQIMDGTMSKLNKNLKDLDTLQQQIKEDVRDEDFASFQRFMRDFEEAQNQINAGLHIAREGFFSAESYDDLLKGQIDLSAAAAAIQGGLMKLESLTYESKDPELISLTPHEMPGEIEKAIGLIDNVLDDINKFTESGRKEHLHPSLEKLTKAKKLIEQVLEEYEESDDLLDNEDDYEDQDYEDVASMLRKSPVEAVLEELDHIDD